MRRLVFCFDGSWNKLDTKTHPTNVVLVAESVLPIDNKGVHQIVYYDEGVGTHKGEVARGGALGKGLILNIREAYRFLIFNYQPGDEIFVFGFSRGAFTARSFIGFIRCAGILLVNDAAQINRAWELYQDNALRPDDDPEALLEFRREYCPQICVSDAERDWRRANGHPDADVLRVRYCGVWDTVGSLGWKVVTAPFDRSTDKAYSRHDTELSPTVESARHALAIDERRVHFMPTLWRNVRDLNSRVDADHYDDEAPFQQKWFAGDHGSVGGGGPERGLSNAALHWVLRGAIGQGLDVKLEDRSQLRDIGYNADAPLQNTPSERIEKNRLGLGFVRIALGWLKRELLTADRSGPTELHDLHPSALRRWFMAAENLPEKRLYRPTPLNRIAGEIEKLRDVYVPVETKAEGRSYTVKLNDTLGKIAKSSLGDKGRYREIFELNRDVLDSPHDLFPGQVLRLPPAELDVEDIGVPSTPA